MKLPGQCWERMGYVVFLPHGVNPNDDPWFTGWVEVTDERAREVLEKHNVVAQDVKPVL